MSRLGLLLALASLAACSSDPGTRPPAGDGGVVDTTDTDGDTITDGQEGAREMVDTDGDGIPDFRDDDSDGDGILDRDEAGDLDPATPPTDVDGDTIPDFRDTDADGNGIPDGVEGTGDADGDGIADFRDTDDDNDFVPDAVELADGLDPPIDTDGDGFPNFRDPDSDNDNILDGHERDADADMDGLYDWEDLDSDNDGIPDLDEAGDADLRTPPVDSDGDMIPDFRDPDSDNDGLSDADERTAGTDPRRGDTDGDGVSDLIEVAAGTDGRDPMDSPRTRGDFVFVVPYMEPPDPTRDTLRFRTSIQFADIYFLFDISGSMSGEIAGLRAAVTTLIGDLQCTDSGSACMRDAECAPGQVCSPFSSTCIEDPGASSCILSPWTGAGYYENYIENHLSLQADPAMTSAELATWAVFGGTEEMYEAVTCVANPMAPGCNAPRGCATPMPGFVGCPAFRQEAVKILVTFSDEDSDGATTVAQASAALTDAGITFIGVWSGGSTSTSRAHMVSLATMSGSTDRSGVPLVFDGADASVVPAVAMAINEIVEGVPLRVTIGSADEPDDAGDSLQFIERLETNTTGAGCTMVATEDTDMDGFGDAYPSVTPGTPVCFDVIPRMNTTVMPTISPQVFRARLTIYGDGSPLDSRIVFFLVPPEIPDPILE